MNSYNELITLIDAVINRNGVQAITGQVLNGVLKAMVQQLGAGYSLGGVAKPTDDPGTPEAPVCYFASEVGTYTNFGGISIVAGELALLCYDMTDGWFKETMYEGFASVGATIDGNVGTPAVDVTYNNGILSFDFRNMKGNPGQDGDAAGFGTIGATVDGNVGTPSVSVQESGPNTAKNLQFNFSNLKGETGVTSVVVSVDNTSGTPQCAVSLAGQVLTLAFTGLKGAQGDTGSSVDYPFTIVNNLTTNDATQALSAAQGVVLEGEISQLEQEVDELYGKFTQYVGWMSDNNGTYNNSVYNGFIVIPIREGQEYEFTCNATPCQLAFLDSFNGIPSTTFDHHGNRIIITSVGAKETGVVPSGVKYLYVLTKYNNNTMSFPTIVVGGIHIATAIVQQGYDNAENFNLQTKKFYNELRDSFLSYSGWMSSDSGAFTETTNNGFIVLDVQEGVNYTIKANQTPCHLAFLNSFTGKPTSSFDIDGSRIVLASVGATTSGVVPTGAKYVYILTRYKANNITLPDFVVGGVNIVKTSLSRNVMAVSGSQVSKNDLGMTAQYTETVSSSDAQNGYVNPNYEEFFSNASYWTSNPIWLHKGDVLLTHTPYNSNSIAEIALATTNNLATAKFQTLVRGNDQNGYQDYTYTVQEEGYYVVCWSADHSGAYAQITHAAYSDVKGLQDNLATTMELVAKMEEEIGPAINVFGDILPRNFKKKYFDSQEDMEVVCVGDSLTGLTENCNENNEPEHLPPGFTHKHWCFLLWDRICLNKPVCDRLDSQRNETDVFTKTGTWTEYSGTSSGDYGDYSNTALTFRCGDNSAAVAFALDLDEYKKASIVFSANPDGAETKIVVSGGNGKLLASIDKSTWSEANNFAVSQKTTNLRERHRRIWLKAVEGATGEQTITYQRTDTVSSIYMYCWGVERWNEASVFVTNLGRGGRNITLLNTNIADVFDRNPDLCILELPLANETVVGGYSLASLRLAYSTYISAFLSGTGNLSDTELMVVLPHGRSVYFDGNQAVRYASSGTVDMINHLKAKNIFEYVTELLDEYPEHRAMVNLMDELYNEGLNRGKTIQAWLSKSKLTDPTMTHDGIHLNTLGSRFWAKYLTAIFQ